MKHSGMVCIKKLTFNNCNYTVITKCNGSCVVIGEF